MAAGGVGVAAAAGGCMVRMGSEGEVRMGSAGSDDPDCLSVKRRSVSLDVNNKYEVLIPTPT
jgi:hypothetical protein